MAVFIFTGRGGSLRIWQNEARGRHRLAAYMIFIREGEIVDPEAMAAYQNGNRDGAPPPGLKPLAVYGAMETLEGEAAEGVVILEFPDTASAKAWYHGPEYRERAKLRQKAATYRAMLVEGL